MVRNNSFQRAESRRKVESSVVTPHLLVWCFRSDFIGKSSPVHFFWGSFDLAVAKFVTT